MRRRRRAVALALVATLAVAAAAAATHAPDHRFVVIGYVLDAAGRPRAGVPVVVTRLKTGLPHRARTEADGLFVLVVHLHDGDEGERLAIGVEGVSGEVIARFDVADKRVERGTRVDVRGATIVEDRHAFAETLRAYLNR